MYDNEIENFLNKHPECKDMSAKEIAKAMLIEAINNANLAEYAYPGIRQKLIDTVNELG